MAKPPPPPALSRMLGKKVVFHGKFGWRSGKHDEILTGMVKAQQGTVVETLDAKVDYLVLADPNASKTVQAKAASLNSKGASIQVLDATAFEALLTPTAAELVAVLRGGPESAKLINQALPAQLHNRRQLVQLAGGAAQLQRAGGGLAIVGESLDHLDVSGADLASISLDNCRLTDLKCDDAQFENLSGCDFGAAHGSKASFRKLATCSFARAVLHQSVFSGFDACDFSGADLTGSELTVALRVWGPKGKPAANCVFADATLKSTKFMKAAMDRPDFRGVDLSDASLIECSLGHANFQKANLHNASLLGCKLKAADFSGADLRGANLGDADLTGAVVDGANLAGCNLRGAILTNVDLSKALNYDPASTAAAPMSAAVTELDQLAQTARRITFTFLVRLSPDGEGEEVSFDSSRLQHGWPLQLPHVFGYPASLRSMAAAFDRAANALNRHPIRFETLEVSSTKSPKSGKELRDLVLQAISDVFKQPLPPAEELAAVTKAWRDAAKAKTSAAQQHRADAKKAAEAEKAKAQKTVEKRIAKEVGKVADVPSFLKALELRIDAGKISNATKMLKASGFKLFNDVTDSHLNGVVKSQTDPDLVYACRIEAAGQYACCTQNLNICGGLRGSICKHLLVLIIGLVQAGELDPTTIDTWISKTTGLKPVLNKETMGEIFIRYKGAEAGEVDWRPTQTVPEDYYAL